MQDVRSIGLGLVALAAVTGLVWSSRPEGLRAAAPASASASAAVAAAAPSASASASTSADAETEPPAVDLAEVEAADAGPLPPGAPKRVGFAVVLFQYAGAQGAPREARSKAEALERARAALAVAQTDFPAAVKLGDPGSTTDAGRMPRGVLERSLEYALFTLEKGQVAAEPIDTPRGWWVVRRTD